MSFLPPVLGRLIDAQFRFFANVLELGVALVWALIGLTYVLDPEAETRSPVGSDAQPYDTIWSVFYLLALPFIWGGVIKLKPHWRVAGLLLLCSGLVIQGAVVVQHATIDSLWEPRTLVYWVYAVAVGLRAAVIVRYYGTRKSAGPGSL